MEIRHNVDDIMVATIYGEMSDHKILVLNSDGIPDYLLNKIAPSSLIKLVEDPDEVGKFKFVVNSYDQGSSSESNKGEIYRCVNNFSTEQIDAEFKDLHTSDTLSNVLIFPITIALGEIRSFGIYYKNRDDIVTSDKIEIAIVSNTVNNIAGSKVEFFAGYYGYNNPNNTCSPGDDFKSFNVHTKYDKEINPNLVVSDYAGVFDDKMNYHYVIMFLHSTSTQSSLLAKSSTRSKIVEVGKNMNYCGRFQNKTSIFQDNIITRNESPWKVSDRCSIENNMNGPIPYIEFYQLRNLGINGGLTNEDT